MSAFSGNVKVPFVGEVPKVAAFGGVGVVVVLVVMHYRNKGSSPSGSSASSGSSGTDAYPPDGTSGNPSDPNSVDPSSGVTYGNEGIGSGAVTSAYGLTGGSGGFGTASGDAYPWDGTTGNPNDPYSMDPSTGTTYGDEGNFGGTASPAGGPPFTSNAAWSQYAEQYLTGTAGLDAATVSSALGAYLAGQQVTAAQKDIIDQAAAFAGHPPVTGPGGYPPSIRLQHAPSHNGTVTVPKVTGQPQEAAIAILSEAGLHAKGSPVIHGKTLTVDSQKPGPGAHVQKGSTVVLHSTVHKPRKPVAKVKVPKVTGLAQDRAGQVLARAGLRSAGPHPVRGKTHIVTAQSPAAGHEVPKGTVVHLTSRLV